MNDVNRLIEKIGARRFDIAEPFGAHSDYISGFDDCAALVIDSLCEDVHTHAARGRVIEQPKYISAAALKDALLEAGAINLNGIGIIDSFPCAEVVSVTKYKAACAERDTVQKAYIELYGKTGEKKDNEID